MGEEVGNAVTKNLIKKCCDNRIVKTPVPFTQLAFIQEARNFISIYERHLTDDAVSENRKKILREEIINISCSALLISNNSEEKEHFIQLLDKYMDSS